MWGVWGFRGSQRVVRGSDRECEEVRGTEREKRWNERE